MKKFCAVIELAPLSYFTYKSLSLLRATAKGALFNVHVLELAFPCAGVGSSMRWNWLPMCWNWQPHLLELVFPCDGIGYGAGIGSPMCWNWHCHLLGL